MHAQSTCGQRTTSDTRPCFYLQTMSLACRCMRLVAARQNAGKVGLKGERESERAVTLPTGAITDTPLFTGGQPLPRHCTALGCPQADSSSGPQALDKALLPGRHDLQLHLAESNQNCEDSPSIWHTSSRL